MLTLAAAFALTLQGDRAGNRIESFQATGPAPMERTEGSARHCSADRLWCATISHADGTGWTLTLGGGSGAGRSSLGLAGPGDDAEVYTIWPYLIRTAEGGVLVGALSRRGGGFSGGGWRKVGLRLFRIGPEGMRPVLDLPIEASATIRACFTAADRRNRRRECLDEYSFAGTLGLDPDNAAGLPRLLYVTSARTYPGRRSREEDSTQARPLGRQDLRWWRDPACSYVRSLVFEAASGRYRTHPPFPDCDGYFDFE